MMVCHLPGCDGIDLPGTTLNDFLTHQRDVHLAVQFPDLNDWRTHALTEVRRLAATGREFRMYEVCQAIGDPPNHKTAMGQFARDVAHLGIAHITRFDRSKRPGTNSSGAGVWRGGPDPNRQENAA